MDIFKDLSKVNHELRSPLNGIVCMGSLLQDSSLDDEQRELLEYILKSSHKITALIDELIEASQLYGGTAVHNKEHDLCEVCNGVWDRFSEKMKDNELEGVYLTNEKNCQGYFDNELLESALEKLLSNAVKFTPKGGSIGFKWKKEEGKISFIITDTGCGIDSGNAEDIFTPFFRVHNDLDKVNKGIGLGLFIARKAAHVMGGDLILKRSSSRGSEFVLTIPENSPEPVKKEDEAVKSVQETSSQKKTKKVLIVDDSEVNRYFLRTLLKREDWTIAEAENGKEAVEISETETFDVILLDVNMPVMDGIEASLLIKKRGKGEFLIGLTAHNILDSRDILKRSGMNTIFSKPVDVPQLINIIENH